MTDTMRVLKVAAFYFGSYWKWTGPKNIRAHHLKVLRKDILLLAVLVNAERKKGALK